MSSPWLFRLLKGRVEGMPPEIDCFVAKIHGEGEGRGASEPLLASGNLLLWLASEDSRIDDRHCTVEVLAKPPFLFPRSALSTKPQPTAQIELATAMRPSPSPRCTTTVILDLLFEILRTSLKEYCDLCCLTFHRRLLRKEISAKYPFISISNGDSLVASSYRNRLPGSPCVLRYR